MSLTKKMKNKFRIKKAEKHTRKRIGAAGLDISKVLSNALKNARQNWDYGVTLTQQENPKGQELDKALQYRGVNEPGWTNDKKKEELKKDGNEFNIIGAVVKTEKYPNDMNYWYKDNWKQAHIHVYGPNGAGFHPKSLNAHDLDIAQTDGARLDALNTWVKALDHGLGARNKKANWKTFFTAVRPMLRDNRRTSAASSSSAAAVAKVDKRMEKAKEVVKFLEKILGVARKGWEIAQSESLDIDRSTQQYARKLNFNNFCDSSLRKLRWDATLTEEKLASLNEQQLTSLNDQLTSILHKVEELSNDALRELREEEAEELSTISGSDSFKTDLKNLLTYIFMIKWCSVGANKYTFPLKWQGEEVDTPDFIDKIWNMNVQRAALEEQFNRGDRSPKVLSERKTFKSLKQAPVGRDFLTTLGEEDAVKERMREEELDRQRVRDAEATRMETERMAAAQAVETERKRVEWEESPAGVEAAKAAAKKAKAQARTNNDSSERRQFNDGWWYTKQNLLAKLTKNPAFAGRDRRAIGRDVETIWNTLQQRVTRQHGGKSIRKRKKNQKRKTKRRHR